MADKKLFIILPGEEKKKEILFESFIFPNTKQIKVDNHDLLITFILEEPEYIKDLEKYIDALDMEKAAEVQKKLEKSLKEQSNAVVKCIVDKDNTPLFDKIKSTNKKDTAEICRELSLIVDALESGLKDFLFTNNSHGFSKIIVAAHPGREEIRTYLDMQDKINKQLTRFEGLEKIHFVYFSAAHDNPSNKYIFEKYPSYSYYKLIDENTKEQFKMFLEILEARANKEEIKFLNTVFCKRLINDLIRAFLQVSLDCSGIIHLEKQKLDTSQYKKESFDSLSLKEYLSQLRVESILFELSNYSPGAHKKLAGKVDELKGCTGCEEFEAKFNNFKEEAAKIKQSL